MTSAAIKNKVPVSKVRNKSYPLSSIVSASRIHVFDTSPRGRAKTSNSGSAHYTTRVVLFENIFSQVLAPLADTNFTCFPYFIHVFGILTLVCEGCCDFRCN